MDLSYVVRYYIEKMLKEVTGMKAMLLDSETTRIVSTVYSQSEILEQEVYLVEKLDSDPGEQLLHLKVRTQRPSIAVTQSPSTLIIRCSAQGGSLMHILMLPPAGRLLSQTHKGKCSKTQEGAQVPEIWRVSPV